MTEPWGDPDKIRRVLAGGETWAVVGLADHPHRAAHGVAIVPQGGNTGMSAGATPDATGTELLLSLRRLDRIEAVDPAARQVTCQAGVVLETLHHAVAEHGLRFPLTLGGKGSATIGGLISTNAGGGQVLRHGSMRSLVLGLEAVLAGLRALHADDDELCAAAASVFDALYAAAGIAP